MIIITFRIITSLLFIGDSIYCTFYISYYFLGVICIYLILFIHGIIIFYTFYYKKQIHCCAQSIESILFLCILLKCIFMTILIIALRSTNINLICQTTYDFLMIML